MSGDRGNLYGKISSDSPHAPDKDVGSYRYEASLVAPYVGARSRYHRTQKLSEGKATSTLEVSLFSTLSGVTASVFRQGVTPDGDPKACQGIKGNLHNEISSDSPMPG
ncbi:hypothetical protein Acr_06g0001070 [Actinidia rufa]|uniref:Uncharacterized protein n=1 Tax=Actinidia rufa TaxID=165716 RepID=A0A7J0ERG8_9ERIC|nr:hypothetical protein Acr_06g0001070 [Actinidia rufa]